MRRWPADAPAAHDAGVRAVFAFPLQVGAARLGVLDVFRTHSGGLTRAELGCAFTLVEHAVATLLDSQQQATTHNDGLDEAFEHRAGVYQAQGMVMVQLRSSLAEALARMRAYAYAHDRPLRDIAADVVARHLRFDPDPPHKQPLRARNRS